MSIEAKEEHLNQLPPQFKNWLAFYDDAPEHVRQAQTLECDFRYSADDYYFTFGQPAPRLGIDRMIRVVYRVDRDYMLARIAEQLLPARLTFEQLDSMRKKAATADSYGGHAAYLEAAELMEPLWAVAKRA